MTAKEKVRELIESFYLCMPFKDVKLTSCEENPELIIKMEWLSAKQCALIAVDEILKNLEGLHKPEYCAFDAIGERKFTFESEYPEHMTGYDMIAFWQEVKKQIELTPRPDNANNTPCND